jgi:hypothetical protein
VVGKIKNAKETNMTNVKFYNGDVFDIGQTVNGVSKFIYIEGKWHYFTERLMREYEYDQQELGDVIINDNANGIGDVEFLGNVFNKFNIF